MAKALLIVEGANLEPRFFSRMSEACGMELEIVPFRANIYLLYRKLKEYGFDYDVRVALRELISDEDSLHKLQDVYAYTYLVFDCDAHHSGMPRKGATKPGLLEIVGENYARLVEMAAYFTDETDPERGRLFINYPMMEAYRDCDSYEDEAFVTRVVVLEDLVHYKQIVGTRKMASCRIDSLTSADFIAMTHMHEEKAQRMISGDGNLQDEILNAQRQLLSDRVMSVLNTSVLILRDYKIYNKD